MTQQGSAPAVDEVPSDSPATAMVYLIVGAGLAMCLVGLLFARASFSLSTIALALLATVPFLLYARLALVRPGADAVVAGVLVLSVGAWGSLTAIGDDSTAAFVQLPLALVVVELAVFAFGALLRAFLPPRA
ncbi:MAG: hypothetical protein JWM86_1801 [Thermoleophilia bacterium]|nr:hypothetical protein [Thermoleophilia bacterium]